MVKRESAAKKIVFLASVFGKSGFRYQLLKMNP
jgi:hypothetical protein